MRFVLALVVGIGFGLGPSAAHAERKAAKKVDWSEFLEKPGDRVTYRPTAPAASDGKRVKGAKAGKKAKRAGVKARAKKARAKSRRK